MGEWKTVYEDEERWVTVKVYKSEGDRDEDEDPVVRVIAAPIEGGESGLEQNGDGTTPVAGVASSLITLEPDPVDDLEEELIEIGFSPVAATWIVSKFPV
jgi:hypothetical protein